MAELGGGGGGGGLGDTTHQFWINKKNYIAKNLLK